ncbi:hypothetical protein [Natrinema amylolyticum]|uniref:hypothetical protein n=1 Tax=Natrinema amylolyticum TaxID=2878679 RepID=UPI001CF962DC|nr:hypothetical protein [Natrinema amylolyticum]
MYDGVSDADVTVLAVDTPSNDDGRIDWAREAAAEATGETLADSSDRHLVVVKSTAEE